MDRDPGPHEVGANIAGERPAIEPAVETDEVTITDDAELERTLGLAGGLAIGIGTMIGAGIFVSPGLAAGRAGPGAFGGLIVAVARRGEIVIGEPSPTLRSMLLGEETERIATESVGPVLVVRRVPPAGEP